MTVRIVNIHAESTDGASGGFYIEALEYRSCVDILRQEKVSNTVPSRPRNHEADSELEQPPYPPVSTKRQRCTD